jgi:2-iminobutanoate/2-iminopropanoate deaminase
MSRSASILAQVCLSAVVFLALLSTLSTASGGPFPVSRPVRLHQLNVQLQHAEMEATLATQKLQDLHQQKEQLETSAASPLSAVRSPEAPNPVGPYSQAIKSDGMVFASGCIGLDPLTGKLVEGGAEAETVQAMKNLRTVLEAAESDLTRIMKTTIFVTDLKLYALVNKVYAEFLKSNVVFPARSMIQVSALPLGALVEIEAIASSREL